MHITVVGDLILDRYLIGDATKLNPEMPGVVIRIEREEERLGGAAAVAMIAAGFGARVTLAGVIGNDQAGKELRYLLGAHGIEPHIWTDNRPTTWKQRIVARGQLRPDRCDRETTARIGVEAIEYLLNVRIGDALLIQDYGKGVCTSELHSVLVKRAHDAGVSILVDPARSRTWLDYGRVTLIKANWAEALEEGGNADRCPRELAKELSSRCECNVVITLGDKGMVCSEWNGDVYHIPAVPAEILDVCGAGDTILASIGVSLARGMSLKEACSIAAKAAARQVSGLGVSPISDAA